MGQKNGTAQALFLQGFGSRPETYRFWNYFADNAKHGEIRVIPYRKTG
jgi:hypothetical protein